MLYEVITNRTQIDQAVLKSDRQPDHGPAVAVFLLSLGAALV